MKVLIVFAHPEDRSFSAALKERAVAELTAGGHEVVVSDLYRMGWKAALGPDDFDSARRNAEFLDLSVEQEHAFAVGVTRAEVAAEQAKVADADLVLFHFPMWWFSMPAILKGWVDRVFSRGFAYSAGRKYSRGHFRARRRWCA
jgi:NAD(P)H dehydrogenase (quinone)